MDDLVALALDHVEESFIAASGPGGQNVNKVATAVQLRLDVFALRLPPEVFLRLKALAGSRMNARGEIVLTADRHPTVQMSRFVDRSPETEPQRDTGADPSGSRN